MQEILNNPFIKKKQAKKKGAAIAQKMMDINKCWFIIFFIIQLSFMCSAQRFAIKLVSNKGDTLSYIKDSTKVVVKITDADTVGKYLVLDDPDYSCWCFKDTFYSTINEPYIIFNNLTRDTIFLPINKNFTGKRSIRTSSTKLFDIEGNIQFGGISQVYALGEKINCYVFYIIKNSFYEGYIAIKHTTLFIDQASLLPIHKISSVFDHLKKSITVYTETLIEYEH